MEDPVVKQVEDNGTIIWEASGLGIVARHHQQWQAKLNWLFLSTAQAIKIQEHQ